MPTAVLERETESAPVSLTGAEWVLRAADERQIQTLMQRHGLPEPLARILAIRGVEVDAVESFLNPSLKDSLPDPSHLLDMDKAAARVAAAVTNGEKIAIFGDYDVDGATSSALLLRFLRAVGADVIAYIPDRMKEGYGPNAPALLGLKEQGRSLVITVDCGQLAFEPLEAAANAGLDVIVIDHHIGEARLPKAYAVVNPNRLDESSPHKQLAAVGVAFLLAVAVNRELRKQGYFNPSPQRGEVRRGAPHTVHYPIPTTREFARDLRKTLTDAETMIWQFLRRENLGVKFRKQHPVGPYIADFACLERKLIVELDGGQHGEDVALKKDAERTKFLEAEGFEVLRFWNNDVFENTEGLLETIYQKINAQQECPPPNLPPLGGGVTEPDLKQWLDIVALGTVCDVVPLTGANRAFVAQGLKVMAARGNTGMRTAMDLAGVDAKPSVYHAGFVLGPRINAGGRVGKSDLGVRLLTTDDPAEALGLAKELEKHNDERKAIEAMVLEQALLQAEQKLEPLVVLAEKGWHPGVLGIVAGRVKERFHKPTAVIGVTDGVGKASCRSVEGFDIGAAVIAARENGLLVAGGGHAMAAGFTVEEAKIPALAEFLNQRMIAAKGATPAQRKLSVDAVVSIGGLTVELLQTLERVGPFGQGNPQVRLMLHNVVNFKPEWTKDEVHARTLLICPLSNARLFAIAFRAAGTKLGEALFATRGKRVSLAGRAERNEWMGKVSVSFHIEDIAEA